MTIAGQCAALIPGEWRARRNNTEAWLRTDRHALLVMRRATGMVAAYSVSLDAVRARAWSAEREDVAGALTAVRDLVVGAGEGWPW